MAKPIAADEVQASLPELLVRIELGDEVAIARDGRTVARLVLPFRRRTHALGELARLRRLLAVRGFVPFTTEEILALRSAARALP
jgi:antitoxin (DNA-binding transcriptional repressor) of toxin-antitoxin stability system